MKKQAIAIIVILIGVSFFMIPMNSTKVMPCVITGPGYSSLSYRIFNVGLDYVTNLNGAFFPPNIVFFRPIPQSMTYCW